MTRESRDDIRRQFLRSFLHDLATPLSAVSLHLEGASRRLQRGVDVSESLNVARNELSRAFDLFEHGRELLLAVPASGRNAFEFDSWVESTIRAASDDGIELHGETHGTVVGDRERLSEALTALVSNALESGPPSAVRVFRERDGGNLRVRVENLGSLPGDDPEKLFAPRSAKPGRNWGMGLPRARLFVADAGGSVHLRQSGDRVSAVLTLPEEPQ